MNAECPFKIAIKTIILYSSYKERVITHQTIDWTIYVCYNIFERRRGWRRRVMFHFVKWMFVKTDTDIQTNRNNLWLHKNGAENSLLFSNGIYGCWCEFILLRSRKIVSIWEKQIFYAPSKSEKEILRCVRTIQYTFLSMWVQTLYQEAKDYISSTLHLILICSGSGKSI